MSSQITLGFRPCRHLIVRDELDEAKQLGCIKSQILGGIVMVEEDSLKLGKANWGLIAIALAVAFTAGTFGSLNSVSFQIFFTHFVGFLALLGGIPIAAQFASKESSGWNGIVLIAMIVLVIGAFSVLMDGIHRSSTIAAPSSAETPGEG